MMAAPFVDADVPLDLAVPSTRGNSLLTDICRWFLRTGDPWLPTAAYVELYADLGVLQATARTALHRMNKGGYLVREARDGTPGYAMAARWREWMDNTLERNKHVPSGDDDGRWFLITTSVPEERRAERHVLRAMLTRAGCASLGNGVWVAPDTARASLETLLKQSTLDSYVDLFIADYAGFEEPVSFAKRLWDVDSLARAYRDFVRDVDARLRNGNAEPRDAFVDLITTSNAWRLIDMRDPGLPRRALPGDWPGEAALRGRDRLIEARLEAATRYVETQRASKLRANPVGRSRASMRR